MPEPRYIRVRGQLYERVATKFTSNNPEVAIIDPSSFEVTDAHLAALARSVIVAFAYAMVVSGVKTATDLRTYKEEDLLRQIPKILQKLNSKTQFFTKEMNDMRNKGPERYIKDVGKSLETIK